MKFLFMEFAFGWSMLYCRARCSLCLVYVYLACLCDSLGATVESWKLDKNIVGLLMASWSVYNSAYNLSVAIKIIKSLVEVLLHVANLKKKEGNLTLGCVGLWIKVEAGPNFPLLDYFCKILLHMWASFRNCRKMLVETWSSLWGCMLAIFSFLCLHI